VDPQDLALIPHDDRPKHTLPAIGAVDVAGAQNAAFQVAELVEHEKRMVAGAFVMAVPNTHLLFAVRRAHARIHVEHDATGRPSAVHKIDPLTGQVGKSRKVLGCRAARTAPAGPIRAPRCCAARASGSRSIW